MTNIVFTRGLIGSGKSTWAKQFVKDNQKYKRISRDDLRHMLSSYTHDAPNEELVTLVEQAITREVVKNGYNIVYDEQNLQEKYIYEKVNAVREVDPDVSYDYVDFPISLEEAIERDSKRDFVIGEEVIRRTWNKYEEVLTEMLEESD